MPSYDLLLSRCEEFARILGRQVQQNKRILIVTHIDADGLSSGSVLFQALGRKNGIVSARAIPDLDAKQLADLQAENYDYYLFTDLGSGLFTELSSYLGERFLVVDHHQLPEEELKSDRILNAWQFDYNGGSDACSATMAYLLARTSDDSNKDLAYLAVVGAVADRQDGGHYRSLQALNRKALEDAVQVGNVTVAKDLLFHGRETRPIHEAIAGSSTPFIPGVSGSKDVALATLTNFGLKLKEGGRWRTLSELDSDEKRVLLELLGGLLAPRAPLDSVTPELLGEVYTMESEDPFTPLRDAREFATLLNACGRMDQTGVGLAICSGDREDALSAGMRIAQEYRVKLNKSLSVVLDETRIQSFNEVTFVFGDETLDERILGSISSIMVSMPRFKKTLLLVRAKSGDSNFKFSSRRGDLYGKEVNLGVLLRETAEAVGGLGGGHSMAAGAKIPTIRAEDFMRLLREKILHEVEA
jgi:RecJ-like exonuclease